jgi:hypothetical protein
MRDANVILIDAIGYLTDCFLQRLDYALFFIPQDRQLKVILKRGFGIANGLKLLFIFLVCIGSL